MKSDSSLWSTVCGTRARLALVAMTAALLSVSVSVQAREWASGARAVTVDDGTTLTLRVRCPQRGEDEEESVAARREVCEVSDDDTEDVALTTTRDGLA